MYMYMYIYIYIHICIYVYIYVYICVCVCVCHSAFVPQVGAILGELAGLGLERNTLFVALSDHQRFGKGALYHGTRTPMLLQWPGRVAPGQIFPTGTLVSSLDLVPTVRL